MGAGLNSAHLPPQLMRVPGPSTVKEMLSYPPGVALFPFQFIYMQLGSPIDHSIAVSKDLLTELVAIYIWCWINGGCLWYSTRNHAIVSN